MTVESIKKKNSSNVIIVFDSGEKITLSYEIMMKRGLRKNTEVTEADLETLLEESEIFHIKQSAFRYLNRRIHSESELKIKLLRKGFRAALVSKALENLKMSGYLDDNSFTKNFIDEKKNRYGWGNKLIAAGLRKRGISRKILDESLKTFSPEESDSQASKLLAKKYDKKPLEELRSIKQKMYSFLFSKGYEYETSERAVEDYLDSRKADS